MDTLARHAGTHGLLGTVLFACFAAAHAQDAGAPPQAPADPAVWGVYAEVLNRQWQADDGSRLVVSWVTPGEELLERAPGTYRIPARIRRDAATGTLRYREDDLFTPTFIGRVQPDGSVQFENDTLFKTGFRMVLTAEGELQYQWLKFKGGQATVNPKYSRSYRNPDGAPATALAAAPSLPPPALPSSPPPVDARAAAGQETGTRAAAAIAPAAPQAPAGAHPVRVITGSETLQGTFTRGISATDNEGRWYDCYLVRAQPGDRWEIRVRVREEKASIRLAQGPVADCGQASEMGKTDGVSGKSGWWSGDGILNLQAAGGYYWLWVAGVPTRNYELQLERKPGKARGGTAVMQAIPAPLTARHDGPAAPVVVDPQVLAQRAADAERIFARLDRKVFQGGTEWQAQGELLTFGWKEYLWDAQARELRLNSGVVWHQGVRQAEAQTVYRFDPASGTYRAVRRDAAGEVVSEMEFRSAGADAFNFVAYQVAADRRLSLAEKDRVELLADGSQRYGSGTVWVPSSRAELAQKVGQVAQMQAARRRQLADERARLAEQRAQEEQEKASGGGGMLRSLVGAAVVAGMASAGGLDGDQVMGAALKGAQIFNPDSAGAAALGATGDQVLGTGGGVASAAGALAGGGGYATRPNLATGACPGFTEGNYRQKAVSGGGDQQLYAMCGQAFEYYTMYKRAIAQGYSEADANRTYAAHQQSAQVAQGYLDSHGAD
ncbi:hypothetical protein [Pseudoxanthomonas sp. 10H]|uniref:hypothetical protein n=1 Tax=Pseudoxanthomonas sp. 10H TaxID=3242729 RepID=UPI003558AD1F